MRPCVRRLSVVAAILLQGCGGNQTMFRPAGLEAERVVFLFQVMLIGSAVLFFMVMLLTALAWKGPDKWRQRLRPERTVFCLGLVLPIAVLTVLLGWGFWLLGVSGPVSEDADLIVRIEGQQWWWRITYVLDDGTEVESANEIRVPVSAQVKLELTSADVLHSFWIPAWAGKMDMIPGRTNLLHFSVDSPGTVRGQCAEYCGGAHALMSLYGVAMTPEDFSDWLAKEAAPASSPEAAQEILGREIFLASGCGSCHRIRGEATPGRSGPDLTHLGRRLSLGAGILENDVLSIETWLARHPVLKPDNKMPAFAFLSETERQALALYLKALE